MRDLLFATGLAMTLSAAPAMAISVDVFTNRAAFESAVLGIFTETFDDGLIDAPLSVASDAGEVANGQWEDRVTPGGDVTTWSIAGGAFGFGADWDMSPGGAGNGIQLTLGLDGGGAFDVLSEIPDTTDGFWGIVADTRFLSVLVRTGTQGGIAETHTVDDLTVGVSQIPIPAPAWLLIGALGVMALFGRSRSA